MQGVRFMVQFLSYQRNGDKDKQPKQRVTADFLNEQLHDQAIVNFHKRSQPPMGSKVRWALTTIYVPWPGKKVLQRHWLQKLQRGSRINHCCASSMPIARLARCLWRPSRLDVVGLYRDPAPI